MLTSLQGSGELFQNCIVTRTYKVCSLLCSYSLIVLVENVKSFPHVKARLSVLILCHLLNINLNEFRA